MDLNIVLTLIQMAVTVGGSLWGLFGVIQIGTGLKDKNGPQLQSGIWQLAGGAMIVISAQYFLSISLS